MIDIKIQRNQKTRMNMIDWQNLGFGKFFSNHMFLTDYHDGKWHDPRIVPYGPIPTDPAMCTLHYGQTVFEGLKAFRTTDGNVNLFRPDQNASRMQRSSKRVCIPPYEVDDLLQAMKELVKLDYDFIPKVRGQALYIRPFVYGDGNFLGVHASSTYKLCVITAPVASYYPEGINPVKILVSDKYVRAVRGGVGNAKTAANYAASLLAGTEAQKQGFAQVLWLDGVENQYVDEVGAMNMFFVINDELITPPLDEGNILPGVTRASVLALAKEWGIKASERKIKISEVFEASKNGSLKEAFGTGTAAVISPVGVLKYKDDTITINDMKIGELAKKFYDTITGIQYGEVNDTHDWIIKIDMK